MYEYLEEDVKQQIRNRLPDLLPLLNRIDKLIDVYALYFGPGSTIPIALVCLQDTLDYMIECQLALFEMESTFYYYTNIATQNDINKQSRVIYPRFYAENVFLRIFSACEHLANYLNLLYNINDTEINKIKEKSLCAKVGIYFKKNKPNDLITHELLKFKKHPHWTFSHDYRNDWVHNQRKIIEGIPGRYKREDRWEIIKSKPKVYLKIFGDQPEITIEELMKKAHEIYNLFYKMIESIVSYTFKTEIDPIIAQIDKS